MSIHAESVGSIAATEQGTDEQKGFDNIPDATRERTALTYRLPKNTEWRVILRTATIRRLWKFAIETGFAKTLPPDLPEEDILSYESDILDANADFQDAERQKKFGVGKNPTVDELFDVKFPNASPVEPTPTKIQNQAA